MPTVDADILLVGSGLGATAIARALAGAGRRVVLVPGIGRTRSPHLDGGIISPGIVEDAFGPGAPLGPPAACFVSLAMESRERLARREVTPWTGGRLYHRSSLEEWAMARAVEAGALFLDDLIEGKALPNGDGSTTLTSERDDRTIRARVIVLCEGADPRIPARVKLRPDYPPEDQLHFARTMLRGAHLDAVLEGHWRTAWGMPVAFRMIPQDDGVIVSVVSRIENVMRSSRSTAEALDDLLGSPAFASLGIHGERSGTGMELVALRPDRRNISYVHDRLVVGIDASGVIDPRGPLRADLTIRGGLQLAEYLGAHGESLDGWSQMAGRFLRDAVPGPGAYHEDRATGYIEEGPAGGHKGIAARVGHLIRRRGQTGKGQVPAT